MESREVETNEDDDLVNEMNPLAELPNLGPKSQALRARGAEVREMNMTSGLQAITRGQAHGKKVWLGGADPRREGVVMGD